MALGGLILLLLVMPLLLPGLFEWTLGLAMPLRLVISMAVLAPVGFLMGVPFPAGIHWMMESLSHTRTEAPSQEDAGIIRIPWIWAANGASSVIASILAALLALHYGFTWVLRLGAFCYAGAWLAVMAWAWRFRSRSPLR